MKKETVRKFDLEAAFKALDSIETPVQTGLKANRVNLKERLHAKHAHEVLVEDYYNINEEADLEAAQGDREAEVAKAKLARIEKIVDLDAETEDDVLPSYVGKFIMQCPQCMTLFYKDEADVETSEENPDVVNINEICQHCGNSSGYTLVGKVGGIDENEAENFESEEVAPEGVEGENELNLDFPEEGAEEPADESSEEGGEEEFNLDDLDLNLDEEEPAEEEEANESLHNSKLIRKIGEKNKLKTDIESEHLTLIEELDGEETELTEATELETDIPAEELTVTESVNNSKLLDKIEDKNELKTDIESEHLTLNEETDVEECDKNATEEPLAEAVKDKQVDSLYAVLNGDRQVFAGTKEECEKWLESKKSPATTMPGRFKIVKGAEVPTAAKQESLKDVEDFDEESFNEHLTKYMTEVYSNVNKFTATSCGLQANKLVVEGLIEFKSGKTKKTTFIFESSGRSFKGFNSDFSAGRAFNLKASVQNKKFVTEGFAYRYKIGESLVRGSIK